MKRVLFILIIAFSFSCTKEQCIYYEYDGVTITRIDKGNEIFFYYGKCGEEQDTSYIKAEYSGINSGMGAFLIFKADNSVEIIRIYDSFKEVGRNPHLHLNDYMENYQFTAWKDSIVGNYDNIIFVSDIIENEKSLNSKNNSKVKAIYSLN